MPRASADLPKMAFGTLLQLELNLFYYALESGSAFTLRDDSTSKSPCAERFPTPREIYVRLIRSSSP